MWTRKSLKDYAKNRLHPNYWKCVLTSLIFSVISGGFASYSGSSISNSIDSIKSTANQYNGYNSLAYHAKPVAGLNANELYSILGVAIVFIIIILIVVTIISVLVGVFLFNPLEVGCQKYFISALYENAPLGHIGFGFSKQYMNIVKIMFLRGLFTFLWSLLFIIPGWIKAYEYRMIPYILSEYPNIDSPSAFAMSKDMMAGNKWNAFVLDLSFILWNLLSAITLNLVGIFYVNPYANLTKAGLYETLKKNISMPAPVQYEM